jgi:hypothetical protein
MWEILKPSDIAQAQQALTDRHAETLRRQQAELDTLAADHAAIENLDQLARAFSQKFRKSVKSSPASVAAATPAKPAPPVKSAPPPAVKPAEPTAAAKSLEPVAAAKSPEPAAAAKPTVPTPAIVQAREKPSRERPPTERRDLSGTNFDIFRRAVSKSTF